MKTQIFNLNDLFQIQTPEGKIYTQKKDELEKDFKTKLKEHNFNWDKIVDLKAIKRKGSKQLLSAENKAKGFHLEMIQEVLVSRNITPKAVIEAEVQVETIEPKTKKKTPPKTKLSLDEALDLLQESKKNIGKTCSFVPFRTAINLSGKIKQVVLDKRVNKVYYRIIVEKNKLYHCEVNNSKIEVIKTTKIKIKPKK